VKDYSDLYNIETDGKIKNVNGQLMFVPYMTGLNDILYKEFIEELLKLDWLHYKLYLVGGILQGWPTTDIDICVIGKRKPELIDLLNKARKIGPLDMYWVKSLKKVQGNGTRVWSFAKSYDRHSVNSKQWIGKWKKDGLYHMTHKFEIKENRNYIKKPLLIN
jgi:hypothetical protein|tara:strand:+ start:153 stop:638 length:486 start_codon:yes stop_codon:yes gene_type:complete